MTSIATTLVFDDVLEIPLSIRTLDDFRDWAQSDEFPTSPRIDYINGRIEVDLKPDDAWFHNVPKVSLIATLHTTLRDRKLGTVFADRMRFADVDANLSAEPVLILVLHRTYTSGKVALTPKASGEHDRYIEIQGKPDLVIEIISDSSVRKDTKLLPPAYFTAGVGEFWLIDVRPGKFLFQIHRRGRTRWQPAATQEDGSQHSKILNRNYRLEQHRDRHGIWSYDLIETE